MRALRFVPTAGLIGVVAFGSGFALGLIAARPRKQSAMPGPGRLELPEIERQQSSTPERSNTRTPVRAPSTVSNDATPGVPDSESDVAQATRAATARLAELRATLASLRDVVDASVRADAEAESEWLRSIESPQPRTGPATFAANVRQGPDGYQRRAGEQRMEQIKARLGAEAWELHRYALEHFYVEYVARRWAFQTGFVDELDRERALGTPNPQTVTWKRHHTRFLALHREEFNRVLAILKDASTPELRGLLADPDGFPDR